MQRVDSIGVEAWRSAGVTMSQSSIWTNDGAGGLDGEWSALAKSFGVADGGLCGGKPDQTDRNGPGY